MTFCPGMPGFWGFFSFFLSRRDTAGFWAWVGGDVLSGFARIFGYLVATDGLRGSTVSRHYRRCMVWRMGWVAGFVLLGASFSNSKNSKKVRDASRSDYVIPASRPSRKLQAVPGEGFSRAVTPRSCSARRWCTTALVALRGGCPLSRAVRRPAFAVTLSSVIRGGDEPLSELSVLARKRSGDRGDLSFPVVSGIG